MHVPRKTARLLPPGLVVDTVTFGLGEVITAAIRVAKALNVPSAGAFLGGSIAGMADLSWMPPPMVAVSGCVGRCDGFAARIGNARGRSSPSARRAGSRGHTRAGRPGFRSRSRCSCAREHPARRLRLRRWVRLGGARPAHLRRRRAGGHPRRHDRPDHERLGALHGPARVRAARAGCRRMVRPAFRRCPATDLGGNARLRLGLGSRHLHRDQGCRPARGAARGARGRIAERCIVWG